MSTFFCDFFSFAHDRIGVLSMLFIIQNLEKSELETYYKIVLDTDEKFKGNILHLAVIKGSVVLTEFLAERVNPNTTCFIDKQPTNALSLAIATSNLRLIPIILKYGGDSNQQHFCDSGTTPFQHFCMSAYAVEYDSDFEDLLWPIDDFNEALDSFLGHGANADFDDDEGDTPLSSAQKGNAITLTKVLLKEKLHYWRSSDASESF